MKLDAICMHSFLSSRLQPGDVTIYVDGDPVDSPLYADAINGLVVCHKRDEYGRKFLDGYELAVEFLEGEVAIDVAERQPGVLDTVSVACASPEQCGYRRPASEDAAPRRPHIDTLSILFTLVGAMALFAWILL